MSENNKKGASKHNNERSQKAHIPRPDVAGVESATVQQYASLENISEPGSVVVVDPQLAADRVVLQQALANPRLLTPQTAPSIQRTVGNRTAQWMIARAVAGQQEAAESQREAKTSLELELEAIVKGRFNLSDWVLEDQWGTGEEAQIETAETETDQGAKSSRSPGSKAASERQNVMGPRLGYSFASSKDSQGTQPDMTQLGSQVQRGKVRRRSILKPEDEDELEAVILPKEQG